MCQVGSTLGMLKLRDFAMRWFGGRINTASPGATDSLDAFSSEHSGRVAVSGSAALTDSRRARRGHSLLAVPLVIVVGTCLGGYFVQKWRPFPVEAASASLTIESDPAGAEVLAAGVRQETTPLTLTVAPGEHAFDVVSAGRRKTCAREPAPALRSCTMSSSGPDHPPSPAMPLNRSRLADRARDG
jgi:hypothetical protein